MAEPVLKFPPEQKGDPPEKPSAASTAAATR